jgi:hypothetical protein
MPWWSTNALPKEPVGTPPPSALASHLVPNADCRSNSDVTSQLGLKCLNFLAKANAPTREE